MKITDYIRAIFRRRDTILFNNQTGWFSDCLDTRYPFSEVIFLNIVELLTDLVNDVELTDDQDDRELFYAFKVFFNMNGKTMLTRLFRDGFAVIAFDGNRFRTLSANEFSARADGDDTVIVPNDSSLNIYVMRSPSYIVSNKSDKQLLAPFLEYLDNILNASSTCSARLGHLIVASPKNLTNAPTAVVLQKADKDKLEEEIQSEYGALRKQKQIMLLPREMSFQTIGLADLDGQTADKVRTAILAICDRIKVPANQVAIIDANSSKSLSNGSELREGDFNKYQSFERLLNATFLEMAREIGLPHINYTIYNKPLRQSL